MAEGHPLAQGQQPVGFRIDRRDRDAELLRSPQQQQWITHGLCRRKQQQTPRIVGDRADPLNEALLDPPRHRLRLWQAEASSQLRCRQSARQLEQRQRVPAHLRDDPVKDGLIQLDSQRRAQQCAGVTVGQAAHIYPVQVLELHARLTCCEHEPDPLSEQAASDKGQRQRRSLIQPLCIIDDAQQRTLLRLCREQTQHRQSDEKPVRRGPVAQPEHGLQGATLRSRQLLDAIEQRCAQLMQAGEREFHFRLHPHRPYDPQI